MKSNEIDVFYWARDDNAAKDYLKKKWKGFPVITLDTKEQKATQY